MSTWGRWRASPELREDAARVKSESLRALFEEAFRTLRTNLLLRAAADQRSFLVTSARPREGKTTVATNLAAALARAGKKVLLVDADLRRPEVHGLFRIPQQPGLAELLRGGGVAPVLVSASDRLHVLPSGELPGDPQELLSSGHLRQVFSDWSAAFDLVILDSAPVLAVADTTLLTPFVDGVILVLQYGQVTEEEARRAKERLEAARSRVVGCVLSHFDGRFGTPYNPYVSGYAAGAAASNPRKTLGQEAPAGGSR